MISTKKQIKFSKPYSTGKEMAYIQKVIESGHWDSGGTFTERCQLFFEKKYGFGKVFLTSSCTDALEMMAILIDIKPGDEVIVPAYTFTSTVNAFLLRGASIVFADSDKDTPNIDVTKIGALITKKTKAIIAVHYAGISCDMDALLELTQKHGIFMLEDAAQAIDSFYKNKPLGSFGNLSAFSFHGTKNITSGEGGMLVINDERFLKRAEIISQKGTNRNSFIKGEINKYEWTDIGSSFTPSEITAAFLFAQLEELDQIQLKRKHLWDIYNELLKPLCKKNVLKINVVPSYANHNAHIFYFILNNSETKMKLSEYLRQHNIQAHSHYLALHKSPLFLYKHDGRQLPNADRFENCLLRMPLYNDLTEGDIKYITEVIINFFYL